MLTGRGRRQSWRVDRWWIWFAGMMGLACVLRVYRLGTHDLWYDETWSVFLINHFSQLVEDYHPPLYYVMLRAWTAVFGEGEIALRSLSVMGSLLTFPAVRGLARRVGGSRGDVVAVLSVLLVVLSPFHIWYAQEARGYAWLTCYVAMALWCCAELFERPGTVRWTAGFVLSSGAALLTAYSAVFFVAPLLGLLLAQRFRLSWRIRLRPALWIAVICVALAPIFLEQLSHVMRRGFWLSPVDYARLWYTLGAVLLGYENVSVIELACYLGLFGIGLEVVRRQRPAWCVLLLCGSAVPVLLCLLMSVWIPVFLPRQMMPALVMWWIGVAVGLLRVWEMLSGSPLARGSCVALLVGCQAAALHHQYTDVLPRAKPSFRSVFSRLQDEWRAGDALVHTIPMTVFPAWYYARELQPVGKAVLRKSHWSSAEFVEMFWGDQHTVHTPRGYYVTAEQIFEPSIRRLWVIYGSWARDGTIAADGLALREWLHRRMSPSDTFESGGMTIERYERPTSLPETPAGDRSVVEPIALP